MTDVRTTLTDQSVLISATELKSKVDGNEPVTFVDVRNPKPWEKSGSKIKGAIRIDPKELPIELTCPKDQLLAFY